jgi:hypothetical protein
MADSKDGEEHEGSKSFRVKDNRRFDSEGNERRDSEAASAAKPASQKPAARPAPAASVERAGPAPADVNADGAAGDEFAIDFSSFVISLATQALMQLGQMKAPDGVEVPVDKNAARQTIDILSMLQRKTKGNLEAAEQQLLEDILHNLRLNFVRVA